MPPNDAGDEQFELNRLLARAKPVTDELGDVISIQQAIEKQRNNKDENGLTGAELGFEKWRLIHKYIHARPFRLDETLSRSRQWRLVAEIYHKLNDDELDEWIELQIEVAANRQQGISDLRVRRDGPCYLIVLEYAANRKRTALAILHWARADGHDSPLKKA